MQKTVHKTSLPLDITSVQTPLLKYLLLLFSGFRAIPESRWNITLNFFVFHFNFNLLFRSIVADLVSSFSVLTELSKDINFRTTHTTHPVAVEHFMLFPAFRRLKHVSIALYALIKCGIFICFAFIVGLKEFSSNFKARAASAHEHKNIIVMR